MIPTIHIAHRPNDRLPGSEHTRWVGRVFFGPDTVIAWMIWTSRLRNSIASAQSGLLLIGRLRLTTIERKKYCRCVARIVLVLEKRENSLMPKPACKRHLPAKAGN